METLITALNAYGKKHGFDKPITISDLIHILNLAEKTEIETEERERSHMESVVIDLHAD